MKNFFNFKDPIPDVLKSVVVYQFTPAGCNSRFICETSRHFSSRIKENLLTDKYSHVQKHLFSSPDYEQKSTASCFTIIDSARDAYRPKLKEALYVSRVKPEINVPYSIIILVFRKQPVFKQVV